MDSNQRDLGPVAFLGCGFMGTAILQGLLANGPKTARYAACVRSDASLNRLRQAVAGHEERVDVGSADAAVRMAKDAAMVVVGCVPGDLSTLITPDVASALRNKVVISLLAGVSTEQILEACRVAGVPGAGEGDQGSQPGAVARVIPSIGAKIGDSVTLLAKSASLPEQHEDAVRRLFSIIGSVLPVPERLMNDATAVGAVCHAVCIQAVDAVADAGVAEGMDRGTAALLAAESMRSASRLFCAATEGPGGGGGMSPEALKAAMSTPRGITINGVLQLQKNGVPAGIADAVRAAVQYSRSM